MATDVVMPQMGESIAEGTIVRWMKKVGDTVDRDEPAVRDFHRQSGREIPSPAAGVVSEIRVSEGETVPVNSVVADRLHLRGSVPASCYLGTGPPRRLPNPMPRRKRPRRRSLHTSRWRSDIEGRHGDGTV